MELCMARYWNTPGDSSLDAKLIFHGVKPSNHHVYMVSFMFFKLSISRCANCGAGSTPQSF